MYIFRYFIIISILLIIHPCSVKCQYGFKKLITYDDSGSLDFDDIQIRNNKIYTSGNSYTNSLDQVGKNVSVFDTSGLLIWQKTYFDTGSNSFIIENSPSRFCFADNGDILVPVYFFYRNDLGLIRIDSNGNELFISEFPNTEYTIYPKDVIYDNGNVYLFGTVQRLNSRHDIYVIKTDSVGQLIWRKYYGISNYHEDFGDIIKNHDGTFTISSDRYEEDFNIQPFGSKGWTKPWLFTIDTSGTIINQWLGEENDSRTFGGGPFYHMTNGDWIIISREFKGVSINGSEFTASAPTITRLDAAHNLEWKLYMADYTGFWDILVDLDYDSIRNEFVAAGHRVVQYNAQYEELEAWVVKFSPDGNVIWSKSDTIYSDPVNGVTHFTAGVDISPSGSIYAAGIVQHNKNPNRGYGWLLKMTPDGCYQSDCSTTAVQSPIDNEEFQIYPNPSTGQITISLNDLNPPLKINFRDATGRKVSSFELQNQTTELNLGNDFYPGVYFYDLEKDNHILNYGKLLIVR